MVRVDCLTVSGWGAEPNRYPKEPMLRGRVALEQGPLRTARSLLGSIAPFLGAYPHPRRGCQG